MTQKDRHDQADEKDGAVIIDDNDSSRSRNSLRMLKYSGILCHSIAYHWRQGTAPLHMLRELSKAIILLSRCDVLEWWLTQKDGFFRCEARVEHDGSLTWDMDQIPEAPDDSESLESGGLQESCRLYGDIIQGRCDPAPAKLTKRGTYWSCNTQLGRDSKSPGDGTGGGYDLSAEGYLSVLLLLLCDRREHVGFFLLKSKTEDFFSLEIVEFLETMAESLAMAVSSHGKEAELRERIKEQECLYDVLHVAERPGISLDEALKGIAGLLPAAWQYPETASARIVLDERSYSTGGFKESPFSQRANIIVSGRKRGFIEVVYQTARPGLHGGPFLREERRLIDALAREVAMIIERRQVRDERMHLQEQIRHADRLATIGQLAAGVAHELNEPLANVLGFAQLAQKKALSEGVREDLAKIVRASIRAREIVGKLKLFARQTPPQRIETNLNDIIGEGLGFLRTRCERQKVKIIEELDPELPKIVADPGQMHQVLVNLVVNAVQAMPEGGTLTLRTKTTGAGVALIVQDTGVGMTEDVRRKVFQPFFTTKGLDEGTGLGLSVVHGIVISHVGTIRVESRPGEGSLFEVHLPIQDQGADSGNAADHA